MARTAADAIRGGLQRLIELQVPQADAEDRPFDDDRLLRYATRILTSRLAGSLVAESQSSEIARRRLVQAGRPADALALSEAINRLHDGHVLKNLPAALQMLCGLMQSSPRADMSSCAGAALLARAAPPAPPMPPVEMARVAAIEPDAPDVAPAAGKAPASSPLANGGKASSSGAAGGADEAMERALVRDVLFVLQNIDGSLIKWDAARDAFVPPPGMPLPLALRQLVGRRAAPRAAPAPRRPPRRPLRLRCPPLACSIPTRPRPRPPPSSTASLFRRHSPPPRRAALTHLPRGLRRLCELGWLFRQIDSYIKAQAAPEGGGGLVVQSFCHALQAELLSERAVYPV